MQISIQVIFNYILNANQLIANGLVIPRQAAASLLYQVVQTNIMPLGSILSDENKLIIATWINAGANDLQSTPSVPTPVPTHVPTPVPPVIVKKPLDTGLTLRTIASDLSTVPAADKPFIRYATYTHIYMSDALFGSTSLFGQAVAKALNSLSWLAALSPIQIVDTEKTVIRFDIRLYEMSQRDWSNVTANYPYISQLASSTLSSLRTATNTTTPVVR